MTALTEQEVQRNIRALAAAIERHERKGSTVPASTVADLRCAARGEIDTDDVIRNIYRWYKGDTSKLVALVRDDLQILARSTHNLSCGRKRGSPKPKLPFPQPERTR
jgi:hypothetical protein